MPILKIRQLSLTSLLIFLFVVNGNAQYKDFTLSPKGDTLNIIDKKGLKQGRWVNSIPEIRGEAAYEED